MAPPSLWQRTTCLLKGVTVNEDGRKKRTVDLLSRFFLFEMSLKPYSLGVPIIWFLFCIVYKWFSSVPLFLAVDLITWTTSPATYSILFYRNQLKTVPDDYYVRVMGIVSIFFCKYLRVFSCLEYKNRYAVFVQLDMDDNEKHHKVFTLHVPMYVCSIWCKQKKKK